ncbi:hypothetical protein [Paracoccus siganidrum]|uniref:Uncharacterized protein n=1 Tax=Paracoccus siganidrum TaxID=1276757 RepID=A0A419A3F6_9RHOB|nr:hypothetical protein [Paracoccus siganidrum]RJL07991.1 hypothetical protein D3P05_16800 [Paracoccus siganidrum]
MSHQPLPGAMELRLDMDEAAITEAAETALIGIHATRLPRHVGHPADDFDLLWQADGTAILTIRLWQELQPPFRHAVVVLVLTFQKGCVSGVEECVRRSFGG